MSRQVHRFDFLFLLTWWTDSLQSIEEQALEILTFSDIPYVIVAGLSPRLHIVSIRRGRSVKSESIVPEYMK